MKILQLCKKFPFPAKDGESLAILNLSKALASQGAEISMLAMNTIRHQVAIDKKADELKHYKTIEALSIDNRIKVQDAFFNLFSRKSYHISRFIDPSFEAELISCLKKNTYDIIQLETLYLCPYIAAIRKYSSAKIALRTHNVEFEIWDRIVQNTPFGIKKWYLAYLSKKLKRFELSQMKSFDILVPITERDRKRFSQLGYHGSDITIPVGIDSAKYKPAWDNLKEPLHLAFIGSLDWMPNVEGLTWFLKHVWPDFYKKFPQITLNIAGRNTPQWLLESKIEGIKIHGEVPDARAFINDYPIMVVPLLSGGGMRVKIVEGMALGRVIITTNLGLEGIQASHGEEVLIADTPYEFVKSFESLMSEISASEVGKNARQLIEQRFDNAQLGKELLSAYEQLIKTSV